MTPEFYNLNYTGPAGKYGEILLHQLKWITPFPDFIRVHGFLAHWYNNDKEKGESPLTDIVLILVYVLGDLSTGYFGLQYMLNGSVVTYATLKNNYFEFLSNTTILYPGHTTHKPSDMVAKSCTYLTPIGTTLLCMRGCTYRTNRQASTPPTQIRLVSSCWRSRLSGSRFALLWSAWSHGIEIWSPSWLPAHPFAAFSLLVSCLATRVLSCTLIIRRLPSVSRASLPSPRALSWSSEAWLQKIIGKTLYHAKTYNWLNILLK